MPLYLPFPTWLSPEIIPGLPLRWYGLMYLVAFGLTYLLFNAHAERDGLRANKDEVANFFFWCIAGLLIGARVLSAFVYDTTGRYWANPLLVFWPFDEAGRFAGLQGMSYHGGLIGAVLGAVIYARVRKIDILSWGDLLVAAIPLGYTFGRLGNFINGELYGRVSAAPWAMVFPHAERLSTAEPWIRAFAETAGIAISSATVNLPRHPSQLYQAAFEGVILWALLWFVVKDRKPFKGFVIGAYMIGYGSARFIIEYFREPDRDLGFIIRLGPGADRPELFTSFLNLSMGQLLSVLMILAGLSCWAVFARPRPPGADASKPRTSSRRLRQRLR